MPSTNRKSMSFNIIVILVMLNAKVDSSIEWTAHRNRWQSVHSCTSSSSTSSSLLVDCGRASLIHIGRAHYGVNRTSSPTIPALRPAPCAEPHISDCTMDYTSKIGEQCNGRAQCHINLISQYVHKCLAPATYFYLTYKCVKDGQVHDICDRATGSTTSTMHLTSPSFPSPTKRDSECVCNIHKPPKTFLNVEIINLQVQEPEQLQLITNEPENDSANASNFILSNHVSVIESSQFSIKFSNDHSVTTSRFWLSLSAYPACPEDWYSLDSKCVRIVHYPATYTSAQEKCRRLGGYLLKVGDPLRVKRLNNLLKNIDNKNEDSLDRWYWADGGPPHHSRWSTAWLWDESPPTLPGFKMCLARTKTKWHQIDCERKLPAICEQEFSRLPQRIFMDCAAQNLIDSKISNSDDFVMTSFTEQSSSSSSSNVNNHDDDDKLHSNDTLVIGSDESKNYDANGKIHIHTTLLNTRKINGLGLLIVCSAIFAICLCFCNIVLFYICYYRRKVYDRGHDNDDRLKSFGLINAKRNRQHYRTNTIRYPPLEYKSGCCCTCPHHHHHRQQQSGDTLSVAGLISSSDDTEQSLLRHPAGMENCCCCCCCEQMEPLSVRTPFCGPLLSAVHKPILHKKTAMDEYANGGSSTHYYEQLYSAKSSKDV